MDALQAKLRKAECGVAAAQRLLANAQSAFRQASQQVFDASQNLEGAQTKGPKKTKKHSTATFFKAQNAYQAAKRNLDSKAQSLADAEGELKKAAALQAECQEAIRSFRPEPQPRTERSQAGFEFQEGASDDHSQRQRKRAEWEKRKAEQERRDREKRAEKEQWEKQQSEYRKKWREHNKSKAPPPKPTSDPKLTSTTISQQDITAFHDAMKDVFANYASMAQFPEPPSTKCSDKGCIAARKSRALAACDHNIRTLFSGFTSRELRLFLRQYHPDRFSPVTEKLRESSQKKAQLIFVVIQNML